MLAVGELLPLAPARRGTPPAPPLDIARTLEEVLTHAPLDFVHVHEPFAPSTSSVALRHSRALNVGTFHAPTERVISTQVARRFVERFFGRLDARTASFEATRELMERSFPAHYDVVPPGAETPERPPAEGPLRIAFCDHEERQAQRLFLRALRQLPPELDWRATIYTPAAGARPSTLRSRLRDRVEVVTAGRGRRGRGARARRRGGRRVGRPVARRRACWCARSARARSRSRRGSPSTRRCCATGRSGMLFEPGDVDTLGAHLAHLIADASLRARFGGAIAAAAPELSWPRVAARFESHLRRGGRPPPPAALRRAAARAARARGR